jgi:hypothetical protein
MYRNFNLTDEERKQIMEMHQTHGYKKPLVEQEEDFDGPEIKFGDSAFPRCTTWGINIDVKDKGYDSYTVVTVDVKFDENEDFLEIVDIYNESDKDDEEISNWIAEAIKNGKLLGKLPELISIDLNTGECDTMFYEMR